MFCGLSGYKRWLVNEWIFIFERVVPLTPNQFSNTISLLWLTLDFRVLVTTLGADSFASVLYHDPDLRSDGSARANSSRNVSMWENLNLTQDFFFPGVFVFTYCHVDAGKSIWDGSRLRCQNPLSRLRAIRETFPEENTQTWNIHMDVWSIIAIYLHISGVFFTTQRCQMWPLVLSSSAALSLLGHKPLFWSWESTGLFLGQGAVYTGWANWIRDCRPLVYFN